MTSYPAYYGGSTPFVTPAELDQYAPITSSKTYLSDEGVEQSRLVPPDSILVCCIGSLGKVGISGKHVVTNQQINALVLDKQVIHPRYALHACRQLKPTLEAIAPATTVKIVNKSRFSDLQIPLPPIEEQRRIAAILDQADGLRAKRRQALAKLDTLTQSLFLEMFGDGVAPKKTIGEVAEVRTGGTPSRENPGYYGGDVPWVKTGEVTGGTIFATHEHLTQVGLESSNCQLFPRGSVIIAMYGQGKTRGQVAKLGIEAATNQACAVILPNPKINSDFLMTQLGSRYVELRELGRGGNQPNLNLTLIKDFEITVPSIEKQMCFSGFVSRFNTLRKHLENGLAALNSMSASIQHRAFRGEL